MKIIIFGSFQGKISWLAKIMHDYLKEIWNIKIVDCDIRDIQQVENIIIKENPRIVVIASAITGGINKNGRFNVDWCERNKAETDAVNVAGVYNIMKACPEKNIHVIFLSTAYIFEAMKPKKIGFKENDPITKRPLSIYSRSKLEAERIIKDYRSKKRTFLILRLNMPIHSVPNSEKNLIDKLKFSKLLVGDRSSITIVSKFLEALKLLIRQRRRGIFNIVSPGPISPFELMEMYRCHVDSDHKKFNLITQEELIQKGLIKAIRPSIVLNCEKIKKVFEESGLKWQRTKFLVPKILSEYKDNK